jgi:hypothetical protein
MIAVAIVIAWAAIAGLVLIAVTGYRKPPSIL